MAVAIVNSLLQKALQYLCALCIAVCAVALSSGCSSSSDKQEDVRSDSGDLELSLEPERITVGTIAFVEATFQNIRFDDFDSDGVTLKFLVPNDTAFIPGSSSLTVATGATPFDPLAQVPAPADDVKEFLLKNDGYQDIADRARNDFYYLVFSVPADKLEKNGTAGTLRLDFKILGISRVPAIFVDLDRGAIESFDAAQANFDGEGELPVPVEREEIEQGK